MKFKLLIFFLCFTSVAVAQFNERNSIMASAGITHHGAENVNTPSVLLAYRKDFYPKTLIEISAAWAAPVDLSMEEEMAYFQSFRFGMIFLFKILEERKQSFKAGMGFSAGLYDIEETIDPLQEAESRVEFLPGFSAAIEYNYILPSQWFFGARASLHRYDNSRRGWYTGATLGYRF